MTYLITGATGYIGTQIARQLTAEGHLVHALYRSASKTAELGALPGIRLFKGDVGDPAGLAAAAEGCEGVFHVAAHAKIWDKDPQNYFRFNVEGSRHVFEAARKAGAKKVVFTSTAGVISPSVPGRPSDERTPRTHEYFTHYERSKAQAEEVARQFSAEGLPIVTVNPTRVYGPGLLSESNGVTRMAGMYLRGKFRLLPGDGLSIGNYAFIDDVVQGHLLAMRHGSGGERYILGGGNASFIEFFELLAKVSGQRQRMFHAPIPLMNLAARFFELRAEWTGAAPLLTPPWVRKYLFHWELSSGKAERELGYRPLSLEEGLRRTVAWLSSSNGDASKDTKNRWIRG